MRRRAGALAGGSAAAQACAADARLAACANFDGLQEGGPFAVEAGEPEPGQPFLFVTKERSLHPRLEAQLAGLPRLTRVVLPRAAHRDFADGPLFAPTLLPTTRPVDRLHAQVRRSTRAFFQRSLA